MCGFASIPTRNNSFNSNKVPGKPGQFGYKGRGGSDPIASAIVAPAHV